MRGKAKPYLGRLADYSRKGRKAPTRVGVETQIAHAKVAKEDWLLDIGDWVEGFKGDGC